MKVLLDTNIIISTILYPNSVPAKAFNKAVARPYHCIICDFTINELYKVFNRKFFDKIYVLDFFISSISSCIEIVPTPTYMVSDEIKLRDVNDRPILRAAQKNKVVYLITGDKDFLESKIKNPIILSPSNFVKLN